MHFEIRQAKIAFGARYSMVVDGRAKYEASSKVFRFLPEINISEPHGKHLARIKRNFSFIRANYDINFSNGQNFKLLTKSFWRCSYTLQSGVDSYLICSHRGRSNSVYRNKRQVAYFRKNLVAILDGDAYAGEADDDVDPLILFSIIIADDNYSSKGSGGSTITFDFGHIGLEERPFNDRWRPNQ
jgi:uncharacterized protein YxjI